MKTILLIDDDDDDQFLFKEAIEFINPALQFSIAANGKIAVEKLKASTSLPDLIFLDLNMPFMNGFEFLEEIKKDDQLKKIPIGIFSTSNIAGDIRLAKQLGARFVLTKPSDFRVLCIKLQQLLSSDFSNGQYISIIV